MVDSRLDCHLHLGQVFFRYRPAAGGAGDTGNKGLQNLVFPLVLFAQLLDPGVGLGDLLSELGLILLCPALGLFLAQSQNVSVNLGRTAALGRFVVSGTQRNQIRLHPGAVQSGKALALQGFQFAVKLTVTLRQSGSGLPLGLSLGNSLVLLALEVDHVLLQLPNFLPPVFQNSVGRGNLHTLQGSLNAVGKLSHHGFVRNHRQIHLQQVFALIPQLLNKIEGVEDGQEHIPLAEHIRQVHLANLIAVVVDGHAVFFADPGQLMVRARLIQKSKGDGDLGLDLVVQLVDAALPEKGEARNRKGDGVGNAGFAQAVAAGDGGLRAEVKNGRRLIALEAGDGHAGDLKPLYLFHSVLLYAA